MAVVSMNELERYGLNAEQPTGDEQPVKVVGKSIVFNPKEMELNKFYMAQLNDDEVYIYRRVSEGEVEVYALAD